MNVPPEPAILEEVATELVTDTFFVEKDWYVTQLIRLLSQFSFKDFQLVFTGGTCLSKAHRILRRFSEDTDFRVVVPGIDHLSGNAARTLLSDFKKSIAAHLATEVTVETTKIFARNNNHFIAFEIKYPAKFKPVLGWRPYLQVEFTISDMKLPTLELPVSSLVNEYAKKEPEVSKVICIDPVENAADKFSALLWRVADRNRDAPDDDPAIVRHLHDLASLMDAAMKDSNFRPLALDTIAKDEDRSTALKGLSVKEKFGKVLDILTNDKAYRDEYATFVKGMTYLQKGEVPTFEQAVEKLQALAQFAD